jgi:hypothetical protein
MAAECFRPPGPEGGAIFFVRRQITEVDMSGKIIAAIAAAVLLTSTGLASAQTRTKAHSQDPYAGTYWEGVVPYGSDQVPDRYAGTIWQGVVPY